MNFERIYRNPNGLLDDKEVYVRVTGVGIFTIAVTDLASLHLAGDPTG
jgi:hypothetical protein